MGRRTEIGSTKILTSEDEHDQTDGKEESRNECNQTWVLGPQSPGSTLDQLNYHGSET
jgi:hypothetical protein